MYHPFQSEGALIYDRSVVEIHIQRGLKAEKYFQLHPLLRGKNCLYIYTYILGGTFPKA